MTFSTVEERIWWQLVVAAVGGGGLGGGAGGGGRGGAGGGWERSSRGRGKNGVWVDIFDLGFSPAVYIPWTNKRSYLSLWMRKRAV
jgi:hypothetical protein